MPVSPRQRVAWIIGILVVVLYALIPVVWIASLSFKTTATIGDKSFFPTSWTFDNYKTIFQTSVFNHALVNSLGIALFPTLIAVVPALGAASALAGLDLAGKAIPLPGPRPGAMFPPISIVG